MNTKLEPPDPQPDLNLPKNPRRRKFLRWVARRSAVVVPALAYSGLIEPSWVRTARVSVGLKNLPPACHGLRIGHISDIHCDNDAAAERVRVAVEILTKEKPDIVCFTGDAVTHDARRMRETADLLAPLTKAPLGAFGVLGNHDWWTGEPHRVAAELRRVGFRVLKNESVLVTERNFWLTGLEQRCDNQQNPEVALRNVPPDSFRILLIHEPDYADEAPEGFALQLSGHSHGGQFRIPGFRPLVTPTYGQKYPEGLKRGPYHLVYTTRGVGMVRPAVRFCCPPEVGVLTLRPLG